MRLFCYLLVTLGFVSCVHAQSITCVNNPALQTLRSQELQRLSLEDQKDREMEGPMTQDEIEQMNENDLTRRKRVGEIFGEGCIQTAEDYLAAFLIYQHGDIPDHYYQAFLFALRAGELHDRRGHPSAALAIDRYLVSIGHKQLFGTQAYSDASLKGCFCMEQVEPSFPDSERLSYTNITLQERFDWITEINQGKDCATEECPKELKPTPRGTIPGFW